MRVICAVLEKLLRRQARILSNQESIIERIQSMSQVLDQVRDFAAKIDEATNAIAARIQTLIDKVNAGTATPEEIAAVLQPEVDRLNELARDPSNPV
jgi:methyl-accepting chemotaxis protein